MFEVTIKYFDSNNAIHYCTYEISAKTKEEAETKALAAAMRNRQAGATVNDTVQIY